MKRDDELNRLIKYAQGMGVSVRFKPYIKNTHSAEWSTDGSEIIIFLKSRTSKLEKILSLIHETAHHKSWVKNKRKLDPKIEEALDSLDTEDEKKIHRKRVLEAEVQDTKFWEEIYHDTNCSFPIKRLYLARDYDIWQYQVYCDTGEFPTTKECARKRRELKNKYKI